MAMRCLNRWHGSGVAAVLLGAFLLALFTAENALPARDEAKVTALPVDLAKVPSDGAFLASLRVADLWNSELGKPVREKLAKELGDVAQTFEKYFGLPLDQVERMTTVLPEAADPEKPLLFVGMTKTYDRDKVVSAGGKTKEEKYKDRTFYVRGKEWAVYPLDEKALVYGRPVSIRAFIDRPAKRDGNLAAALRLAAGKHSAVFALNAKAVNDEVGDKLPGEAEPFKPLLRATSATLTVDLAESSRAVMELTFATEADAKAGVKPLTIGRDLAVALIGQSMAELAKQKDTAQIVDLFKQAQTALKAAKVEQKGPSLQASASLKIDTGAVSMGVLQSVRKVREAAARIESSSNLHNIGIAMHNYADTNGNLPPHASYDKNGKPMLSWRVMILPYIEQKELYKQFHLNEPWDSEHNKKLLAMMPKLYASPHDEKTLEDHTTCYQGFVGKGAFFDGKKGLRIPADFPDGTSNTLMIVEATKAVPWTKPEDIPYDAAKPLPKRGRPGAGGFLALLCDGSVRFISDKMRESTLRLLITRDDGFPIPDDF